jgi:hypothetical protein
MKRMEENRLPKKIYEWTPVERKKRGRPRNTATFRFVAQCLNQLRHLIRKLSQTHTPMQFFLLPFILFSSAAQHMN